MLRKQVDGLALMVSLVQADSTDYMLLISPASQHYNGPNVPNIKDLPFLNPDLPPWPGLQCLM